jgi:protein subunit release factor A
VTDMKVLETPRTIVPTEWEMLRKVRDKYGPVQDVYARAFLSELADRLERQDGVDMKDLKIEPLKVKREGMQPAAIWNDVRVTHIPTGLVVEIPHGFTMTQRRNLKTALSMIGLALSRRVLSSENLEKLNGE